jgi:hypothetical protein
MNLKELQISFFKKKKNAGRAKSQWRPNSENSLKHLPKQNKKKKPFEFKKRKTTKRLIKSLSERIYRSISVFLDFKKNTHLRTILYFSQAKDEINIFVERT